MAKKPSAAAASCDGHRCVDPETGADLGPCVRMAELKLNRAIAAGALTRADEERIREANKRRQEALRVPPLRSRVAREEAILERGGPQARIIQQMRKNDAAHAEAKRREKARVQGSGV